MKNKKYNAIVFMSEDDCPLNIGHIGQPRNFFIICILTTASHLWNFENFNKTFSSFREQVHVRDAISSDFQLFHHTKVSKNFIFLITLLN